MSKNRERKESAVAQLTQQFGRAQAAVLADFRGLNVEQDTRLRRALREAGVEYLVVKNTLLGRAAEQAGVEGLEPYLEGPTAIAFSLNDPVSAARELVKFAKDNEKLQIKAGVLDGRAIDPSDVKALADLPPREVLLAKVLAGMQAPLVGFATVISAPLRGFVTAADQLRKQREGAA